MSREIFLEFIVFVLRVREVSGNRGRTRKADKNDGDDNDDVSKGCELSQDKDRPGEISRLNSLLIQDRVQK